MAPESEALRSPTDRKPACRQEVTRRLRRFLGFNLIRSQRRRPSASGADAPCSIRGHFRACGNASRSLTGKVVVSQNIWPRTSTIRPPLHRLSITLCCTVQVMAGKSGSEPEATLVIGAVMARLQTVADAEPTLPSSPMPRPSSGPSPTGATTPAPISRTRGPPVWDDASESAPDRGLLAQPEPALEFDQRIS